MRHRGGSLYILSPTRREGLKDAERLTVLFLCALAMIEGAFFRIGVKDGRKEYKVRASVDGDARDGSVALGAGDARLWFRKRLK